MTISSSPRPTRSDAKRRARNRAIREADERQAAISSSKVEPKPTRGSKPRPLTPDQVQAIKDAYDAPLEVQRVIDKGHRAPRIWDEINSTAGGGQDFTRR